MKKIFAFVLASLMVLSLVPASAFAAISVDTPCPTIHTVANCDAVIIGSQEADCANPGYTRFQCTKCGEQFLGNIVAAGGHKWVLDEDHKNTKLPACTEGKDGFGHYDCSVCGEAKEEAIPLAKLHDLVFVSGVGCEAAYVCTVCEGTFNSKGGEVGEHAGWELKEVVTEPTAKTNGLAIFVCTAKNCGATKEVTINAQCDCKNDYKSQAAFYNAYAAGKLVLKTKPSKVTCTAAGKYAIYACVDCGAFIRWKTNDSKKSTDLPEAVLNEDGQVTGIKNGKFEGVSFGSDFVGEMADAVVATAIARSTKVGEPTIVKGNTGVCLFVVDNINNNEAVVNADVVAKRKEITEARKVDIRTNLENYLLDGVKVVDKRGISEL
jgi:transposase-like protein